MLLGLLIPCRYVTILLIVCWVRMTIGSCVVPVTVSRLRKHLCRVLGLRLLMQRLSLYLLIVIVGALVS